MRALVLPLLVACREPQPERLWLGGDVHLEGRGAAELAGALAPLAPLTAGRAGVVNLEGAIAGRASEIESGKIRLFNDPAAPAALAAAGVAAAGIANNHAADGGPEGQGATAAALKAAGIAPFGGPAGTARVGGVVVTAHDLSGGVPEGLGAELADAAREGTLIATFHTSEPGYLPPPSLRGAAQIALDAGARVVAAHGSHAVGPVERRGGAIVAWGLGNLLFDCPCTDGSEALILAIDVRESGVTAHVFPISAGLRGRPARPSPDPGGVLDLLEALGSAGLRRAGAGAAL